MSRLILIPLALILLLILAVAVLLPLFLDEDKLLELATTTLQEETGATLTVDGDTRLSLFPRLGLSLSGAAITMPEKTRPDLQVQSLQIGVQLIPLLSGEVAIDTFILDGLRVRVETAEEQAPIDTSKLSDEQLDDFYTTRRKALAKAGDAAGAEAALAVPLALNVQQLTITEARLEVIDPGAETATLVDLVSLQASDLNLDGRPIPLAMTLRLHGEQEIEVALDGAIRVDQQSQAITLDDIDVQVTGAAAATLKARTSGSIDPSRQVADLKLDLELGETRGGGTLRYANFESPQIDAVLQLNLFDPALLALAGPQAGAAKSSGAGGGDEPLPLDTLRGIDTRAVLNIERARFDTQHIDNVRARLRAVDGVIELTELSGVLHGGQLQARATFNAKHNTATLDTSGGIDDLDIATAMATSGTPATVTGAANINWQLTSRGRTPNELTAALRGPVKLDTNEVVLLGTSVEKLICQAVALTNKEQLSAVFPADTRFQALAATIQMADGKAQLQPLRAELQDIALNGSGDLDLLSQDFSATFQARLSPGLEELDHACRVSKRLTAIDWPVNCAGNTAGEPAKWCRVDTEKIIRDLAVHEGRRKLEKEAGKLLNKLFKKNN